jgi:hypothetical protein
VIAFGSGSRVLVGRCGFGLALGVVMALSSCGRQGASPGAAGGSVAVVGGSNGQALGSGGRSAGAGGVAALMPPGSKGIPLGTGCPDRAQASGHFTAVGQELARGGVEAFTLHTPSGAQSGVLTFAANHEVRGWMTLAIEGPLAAVLEHTNRELGATPLAFRVFGDQEYTLIFTDLWFEGPHEITWTYQPVPDCNEPNDKVEEATKAEVGDILEGYMTAGATGPSVAEADLLDWYWVRLSESGTLALTVEQAPNKSITLSLFNDSGEVELDSGYGTLFSVVTEGLPPGDYTIQMSTGNSLDDLIAPSEFGDDLGLLPYQVKVAVEPGPVDPAVVKALGPNPIPFPGDCKYDHECGDRNTCVNGLCYSPLAPPEQGLPCIYDGQCRRDDVCENGLCAPPPAECRLNGDCPAGRTCEAGLCLLGVYRPCSAEEHCERGQECVARKCAPRAAPCEQNRHCPLGSRCLEGTCVEEPFCRGADDCTETQSCVVGRCVETMEPTGCTVEQCGDGLYCDGNSCVDGTISAGCSEVSEFLCSLGEYCDLLFTNSCQHLCETDEHCLSSAEFGLGSYVGRFRNKHICVESLTAYGKIAKECRSTCESEIECPIYLTCTGESPGGRYCEFPNVVPSSSLTIP